MKVYLVGGAVRDSLLNISVFDHDWVIVGATPEELLAMGYQQVGKNFPVFLHPDTHEEYALARTEYKSSHGYTGFTCLTAPDITLEDDLMRRDLTINAIARSLDGVLIDPYQGIADLQARKLRHVSNSFSEDPLRVLRVARFAARFAHIGFSIADETLELMRYMAHSSEIMSLTAERIWKETEKALQSRNPHVYFQVLRKCDALVVLFPEIDALFKASALAKQHAKINNNVRAMIRLAIAAQLSPEVEVRFSALCHDLTQYLQPQECWLDNHSARRASDHVVAAFCKRLRIPNQVCNVAKLVSKYHHLICRAEKLKPQILLNLFDAIDVWRKPHRLEQMILTSEADVRSATCGNNKIYLQGEYLRQAYHIANTVSIQDVISRGLHGWAIRDELRRCRQQALTNWKLTQKII